MSARHAGVSGAVVEAIAGSGTSLPPVDASGELLLVLLGVFALALTYLGGPIGIPVAVAAVTAGVLSLWQGRMSGRRSPGAYAAMTLGLLALVLPLLQWFVLAD